MELYDEFQSIVLISTSSICAKIDLWPQSRHGKITQFYVSLVLIKLLIFSKWDGPAGDDMTHIVEAGWQR